MIKQNKLNPTTTWSKEAANEFITTSILTYKTEMIGAQPKGWKGTIGFFFFFFSADKSKMLLTLIEDIAIAVANGCSKSTLLCNYDIFTIALNSRLFL